MTYLLILYKMPENAPNGLKFRYKSYKNALFSKKSKNKIAPQNFSAFFGKNKYSWNFLKFWDFAIFSAKILQMGWNSDISRKKMKKKFKKIRPTKMFRFFWKEINFLEIYQNFSYFEAFFFEKAENRVNEPQPRPFFVFFFK